MDVETFLRGKYGTEVTSIAPIGQGDWSKAFAYRHENREYVVRFGAYVEDFAKDRLAARYANPALLVPAVLEVGETDTGYYAISERVYGSYLDDVGEHQMRSLLPALFAALDAMRLADLSGTQGYGGWGADGNAPFPSWRSVLLDVGNDTSERVGGWRAKMAASEVGIGPFDAAYARLRLLAESAPGERHLIHSDLLHFNVLVQGARVTGVLDWGCGMYGDFLYDLAWLCFWQPWFPAWRRIDFRAEALRHYETIGLEVQGFEERLRCCQIHIGLAGQAYQAWADDWANLGETAQRTLQIAA